MYSQESTSQSRDISPISNRDTKLTLDNEEINKEINKSLHIKKGLRSMKYRNKNFDWQTIESINGGEVLFEIIV